MISKQITKSWLNDQLVASLLGQFIPYVEATDLAASFIYPLQVVSQFLNESKKGKGSKWLRWGRDHLPASVWSVVLRQYPVATTFPLGPMAERTTKRIVEKLVIPTFPKREVNASQQELLKKLQTAAKKVSNGRLLYDYSTIFIYEIAMLNIRGSHDEVEKDYGFLYHFREPNRLRTRKEESALRKEIQRQSQQAAKKLMIALKKQGPEALKPLNPQALVTAFCNTFRTAPKRPPSWVQKGSKRPFTILGVKANDKQIQKERIGRHAKIIAVHGDICNVVFDLKPIVERCGPLHSLLLDLLEIAVTVYIADIYMPRDNWFARDLIFLIPVRHPEIWQKNAEALARPIRFLSGNMVKFEFIASDEKPSPAINFTVNPDDNRVVSLFSGGIDSFVGTVMLLEARRETWLISHYASNILKSIQDNLYNHFEVHYGKLVNHISIPVHAGGKQVPSLYRLGRAPHQELIQHTRSFLFMTLASCLAIPNGIGEIRINENGIVALNPAFSEARFNTRTAHPIFIKDFQDLIYRVFNVKLDICNPFIDKTKGEVLGLLPKFWQQYLENTNSCWAYSRVKAWAAQLKLKNFQGMHCGRCIPCIWRRAAMMEAGLEKMDDQYLIDHVPQEIQWFNRIHLTVFHDLLRFCQNAAVMSDEELFDYCPDLDCPDGSFQEKIRILKNYSIKEIIPWFKKHESLLSYFN
jgi:7-cyano-7-deazaguanine synthase in queuosine biosynthesis